MTLLEWRDDFNIGIDEVDHEHRELIGLISSLHAELGGERSGTRVEACLGEILTAVSAHFALEEKIMRARHYDAFTDHKADHERLLDDLRDIMDGQAGGTALEDNVFSARLAEWFSAHFRTQDARLHRYLAR